MGFGFKAALFFKGRAVAAGWGNGFARGGLSGFAAFNGFGVAAGW